MAYTCYFRAEIMVIASAMRSTKEAHSDSIETPYLGRLPTCQLTQDPLAARQD